jgi:hypothetical protein
LSPESTRHVWVWCGPYLANLLVCTPGRLLQHMDETPMFDCVSLRVLVLDEVGRRRLT